MSTPSYSIQNAAQCHTDEINDCIKQCFCDTVPFSEILAAGGSQGQTVAHVIIKRRKLCGFGVCQILGNCVIAVIVAVGPQHRRRGAARVWMEFIERNSAQRGIPFVVAALNETNRDGLEFLAACDYKLASIDKGFFQETSEGCLLHRDRIIFIKHVTQPDPEFQPEWLPDRARRLLDVLHDSRVTNRH